MPNYSEQLAALAEVSSRAAEVALDVRKTMTRELKPDGSIVTDADKAVEVFLRKELPSIAPGANIWGEEFGFETEAEGGLWLVDPIDGTSNFAFGGQLWGVTIALMKGEELLLGSIVLPDMNETYLSEKGCGVWLNGNRLPNIPSGEVRPEELVGYGDHFSRVYSNYKIPGKQRLSGAVVTEAAFTLTQRYRGMIGMREKLYDVAASLLMGQELGATVSYCNGEPISLQELVNDRRIGRPWMIFPAGTEFRLPAAPDEPK